MFSVVYNMANPDDPDFDTFVSDLMNATCSSAIDFEELEQEEVENTILHNISASDNDSVSDTDIPTPQATVVHGRPTNLVNDQWIDVTSNDPGPSHSIPIYNINSGPVLPSNFDVSSDPIDYFSLFFNDYLISHICFETNLYANKKKNMTQSPHSRVNKWVDVTPKELKAFIGTIINMGLIPLSNIELYFSTQWQKRIPFFRDVFRKDHFLNIFYNIHFNHNEGQNQSKYKGFLIQPVLEHVQKMCQLFFTPGDYVAVDESTIAFKGKVSFRVYNKNKPTKFGLKVFVLSDSYNGYVYNFIPYFGKEELIPNSRLLKTTQIVKLLTESVVLKDPNDPITGLHVYTDRYYTSPELARELLKMKCFITGTVMTNRVGLPIGLKRDQKKMTRGQMFAKRKGDLLVLSWKDKRVVTMLTTKHKGSQQEMTSVQSKWPNQPPTDKPNMVLDYTKHMGAVDRSDHIISSYQFLRKSKKWYRKMFFWLLEVSIINSYVLYKNVQTTHGKKPLSHAEFRQSLIKDLVAEKSAEPAPRKRGRQPTGPPEERLDDKKHFMGRKQKAVRCVVCAKKGMRRETIYFCKTCTSNPSLHPDDCFELYHTKSCYWK